MVRREPLSQFQPELGFAFLTRTHLPQLSAHARPSSARVLKAAAPAAPGGYDADMLLRMFERLGATPSAETKLLDFGCGVGERVDRFRRKGYHAVGCDLALPDDARDVLRPIAPDPYRLPYEDDAFDIIYSITVFEQVMDYDTALAEIRRVMKPGGVSVHVCPWRWKPIETHAYVPFASAIQSSWWLYVWALLGVRNEFQRGQSAAETAHANRRFLEQETNYLTKREIRGHVLRHFEYGEFAEEAVFRPERYAFFRTHPWLLRASRAWSSATNVRVLVCRSPGIPLAL